MDEYFELESKLGYSFKNKQLIIEALTHKSFKKPYNNERLEFLGDAVLDLIVGEYLYKKFPTSDEGTLSKIRASLVNENGFALLATELNLGKYIYISLAEENNEGRTKLSLLSNAFEAVIGSIYLEAGLDGAKSIAIAMLEKCYPIIDLQTLSKDYKTALQEFTQAKYGVTPAYEMIGATGPDHKKEFEIEVLLDGKNLASASGKSKKEAQQKAAQIALGILSDEDIK
ncbi:Ribonuclease III (RNase III) [Sulfurovum sp. enrichment culture clone C5]|uniref:Ribonuclease 3 n=1 Tax=Sulfurovum sp. enrichment culture clone C5 TaxID=497650 RepID=A0A0S4XQ63_9BACT|nr:Ribonuclease III (RNase III) [Sulfurovum sp. enrichment culture clone C5]